MNSNNRNYLLTFLLALALYGCTHPSEPAPATPTISTIWGAVSQLDTTLSNFDTAIWEPSVSTPVRLLNPDTVALTNTSSFYWFYHLNVKDADLTVSRPGYVPVTIFHA